jgi:hypothetical protein
MHLSGAGNNARGFSLPLHDSKDMYHMLQAAKNRS